MTRADVFELIICHMIEQGIEDSEQFMEFTTMILPMMSDSDLIDQLEILEATALETSTLPLVV
jgi:hypothetical protein